MTECKIWPPEKVFEVPLKELRLLGEAIAKKKGEELKFLAQIHGAKAESMGIASSTPTPSPSVLEAQIAKGKSSGMNIEVLKGGKPVK